MIRLFVHRLQDRLERALIWVLSIGARDRRHDRRRL